MRSALDQLVEAGLMRLDAKKIEIVGLDPGCHTPEAGKLELNPRSHGFSALTSVGRGGTVSVVKSPLPHASTSSTLNVA